jgi:hypothetical protein
MSIQSPTTRLGVSILAFFVVLMLIVPHLMDVNPPLIVDILLKPAKFLGGFVGRILPHGNIGTPEHPIREGTPLDLLAGLALVFFCIFLYPAITYFSLSLLARILRRKAGYTSDFE